MTNLEYIKNMNADEIAAIIMCPNRSGLEDIPCDRSDERNCFECCKAWLEGEAKEVTEYEEALKKIYDLLDDINCGDTIITVDDELINVLSAAAEALKYRIPIKAEWDGIHIKCPNCGKLFTPSNRGEVSSGEKICNGCGQAMRWGK